VCGSPQRACTAPATRALAALVAEVAALVACDATVSTPVAAPATVAAAAACVAARLAPVVAVVPSMLAASALNMPRAPCRAARRGIGQRGWRMLLPESVGPLGWRPQAYVLLCRAMPLRQNSCLPCHEKLAERQ